MRSVALLVLTATLAAGGCDDHSYREIGAAISVLVKKNHGLPGPAIERLRKIGRRAIPQLEIAMHTASARGKLNLVSALDAIAEPEAAAILQHFAVHDRDPEVRRACEEVLTKWAGGSDARTAPARLALARIEEKRRLGLAE